MTTTVFPAFRTTDGEKTIALLTALGFTERALYRDHDGNVWSIGSYPGA